MALDNVAEATEDKIPFIIDNGIERIYLAKLADDFQLFFVKRISLQVTLFGTWMFHKAGRMERADGLMMSDAWRHNFPAS